MKKCGISRDGMVQFFRAAAESILTYAITVRFGNTLAEGRRQLDKEVHTAFRITGCDLPLLAVIHKARLQKKGLIILKDPSHLANNLFKFLPSHKRLRRTSRFQNSTYPDAVRLLNTPNIALQATRQVK